MEENKRVKCPHCNSFLIANSSNSKIEESLYRPEGKYQHLQLTHHITWCPNPDCQEIILTFKVLESCFEYERVLGEWNLLPDTNSLYTVFPDIIPSNLRQDYQEACLIASLSPKASATLSRRCLQGMIRDFWGINEKNLFLEIEKLKDKIDTESFNAIHSLRAISNIGAHPDKDTSTIIDIEPDEAKELIYLIELLFNDWYIAKEEKRKRLKNIQQISASKNLQK